MPDKAWIEILIFSLRVDEHLRDFARSVGVETGPDARTWNRCIDSGLIVC